MTDKANTEIERLKAHLHSAESDIIKGDKAILRMQEEIKRLGQQVVDWSVGWENEREARNAAESENARLREALTPSGATKSAFRGEFSFHVPLDGYDEDGEPLEGSKKVDVPWDTIKQIMRAIAAYAEVPSAALALKENSNELASAASQLGKDQVQSEASRHVVPPTDEMLIAGAEVMLHPYVYMGGPPQRAMEKVKAIYRAMIAAAPQASREGAPPEWQDISTAPKDGTDVLLSNGYWCFEATSMQDGTFVRTKDRRQTAPSNCRFWMPMPIPPYPSNRSNVWGEELRQALERYGLVPAPGIEAPPEGGE